MTRNVTDVTKKALTTTLGLSLAAGLMAQPALAQEVEADETKISFAGGVDYNTHFVSYGFDVWGVGTDFGDDATLNPWAEVAVDFGAFSLFVGTWWDVNTNGAASIGGQIQEIDVYYGLGFDVGDFSFGVTYQDWVYAGGVETILDFSVGYDDSELWGDFMGGEFALSPSLVVHNRLSSTNIDAVPGGDENSTVLVFSIEPGFQLVDSEDYPISLSIPVSVGYFLEEGFHGAKSDGTVTDDGFGYVSIGANLSMPLTFIPAEYGSWSAGAGLTYYMTDEDVIDNEDDNFLTGTIGFSVSF